MQLKFPPVIDTLIKIARSELGPDALPASKPWLYACLAAYVLGLLINALLDYWPLKALGIAITGTSILAFLAAGGLYLVGLGKRLPQTLTALAGTGTVILLVSFAFHFILLIGLPPEVPVEDLAGYLMVPLYLWNAAVFAAIFNTALSSGKVVGYAISISYLAVLFFWVPHFFK